MKYIIVLTVLFMPLASFADSGLVYSQLRNAYGRLEQAFRYDRAQINTEVKAQFTRQQLEQMKREIPMLERSACNEIGYVYGIAAAAETPAYEGISFDQKTSGKLLLQQMKRSMFYCDPAKLSQLKEYIESDRRAALEELAQLFGSSVSSFELK
jgi:hypothetical protein